jgi:hypothetical protein
MSFPKQSEIELPLLKTLQELGGKAEPKELYPKLAEIFPQLTEEDLTARLPSSPSTFRWHNLMTHEGFIRPSDGDRFAPLADAGIADAIDSPVDLFYWCGGERLGVLHVARAVSAKA